MTLPFHGDSLNGIGKIVPQVKHPRSFGVPTRSFVIRKEHFTAFNVPGMLDRERRYFSSVERFSLKVNQLYAVFRTIRKERAPQQQHLAADQLSIHKISLFSFE